LDDIAVNDSDIDSVVVMKSANPVRAVSMQASILSVGRRSKRAYGEFFGKAVPFVFDKQTFRSRYHIVQTQNVDQELVKILRLKWKKIQA
jgi:hypothetical protein